MKRIGIMMPNSLEFIEVLMQIWNDNYCAVIIDYKIPIFTAFRMMRNANVDYCHIDSRLVNRNTGHFDIPIIQHHISTRSFQVPKHFYNYNIEKYNDDDAVVLFSSGTTGERKGIVHTYKSINNNSDSIIKALNLHNDNILIVKSLCHSSTLIGELLVGLKTKSGLFFSNVLLINSIIDYIVDKKITILFLNPSLLELLIGANSCQRLMTSSLKRIYVSGSILHLELLNRAKAVIPNILILNMYGITEAGPRISIQSAVDAKFSPGSVGTPINNVLVKLIFNKECKVGSIYVKTASLLKKYDNAETVFDPYEWFETGDLGFFDIHNNLYVVGRKDNMIHNHSHNIYPEQIEEIICREGGFKDCIVYMKKNILMCSYMTNNCVGWSKKRISSFKAKLSLILPIYEIPQVYVFENIIYNENGKKMRKDIYHGGI